MLFSKKLDEVVAQANTSANEAVATIENTGLDIFEKTLFVGAIALFIGHLSTQKVITELTECVAQLEATQEKVSGLNQSIDEQLVSTSEIASASNNIASKNENLVTGSKDLEEVSIKLMELVKCFKVC